jgi:hypothetical protein
MGNAKDKGVPTGKYFSMLAKVQFISSIENIITFIMACQVLIITISLLKRIYPNNPYLSDLIQASAMNSRRTKMHFASRFILDFSNISV